MAQSGGPASQANRQRVEQLDRTSHFSTGISGPLEDHIDCTSESEKSHTPHCAFGRAL